MNILVTGGLGFIGSALANHLCREHRVTVLARTERFRARLRFPELVQVRRGLIESVTSDDCQGFDLVIHAASTVDNYNILSDPYLDTKTNCNGTIAILEACKEHKPRFVFLSTFFVYGNAPRLPVNEESPCEPLALYPATKLCAEQFCKVYGHLYSFPVNVCRFTNVYGPGEVCDNTKKGALNYLIRKAQLGEPIDVYEGGNFFRDYLYIDDAVGAVATIIEKAPDQGLYLVGAGEAIMFRDLIQCLHQLTDKKSLIRSIEAPRFHQIVGIRNFSADISKIKSLGWKPEITLEEGLRRTLASYE